MPISTPAGGVMSPSVSSHMVVPCSTRIPATMRSAAAQRRRPLPQAAAAAPLVYPAVAGPTAGTPQYGGALADHDGLVAAVRRRTRLEGSNDINNTHAHTHTHTRTHAHRHTHTRTRTRTRTRTHTQTHTETEALCAPGGHARAQSVHAAPVLRLGARRRWARRSRLHCRSQNTHMVLRVPRVVGILRVLTVLRALTALGRRGVAPAASAARRPRRARRADSRARVRPRARSVPRRLPWVV
jgi:hypothetical protein